MFKCYIFEFKFIIFVEYCVEYCKFVESVLVDSIKLIYVLENVIFVSLMMGYIMFCLDGINDKGIFVKYGIMFFIELDFLNVLYIMYEILMIGKEGVFKVVFYYEFE